MVNPHRRSHRGERGFVIHMYTFMMLFIIIPMVGLAIDAGILYTIKGKLQTAVDGAALGAARSLNRGTDIPSQQTAATDTAKRYYHANFPANWMGVSTVNDPTVSWTNSTASTAVIDVQGDIDAPTWFMKILGFNSVHLTVIGESVRRNVNIMLVLDRSQSLQDAGNCDDLITDSQAFVNAFVNARDRMGLVTFGSTFRTDFALSNNFKPSLVTQLGSLVCVGFTNAAAGFLEGYRDLKTQNDQNALNVIVFFTDGQPNTVTFGSDWPGTSASGPLLPKKVGSTCNPTAGNTGFSGVLAGDVSYSFWAGLIKAQAGVYPAASAGEYAVIDSSQRWGSNCTFHTNYANNTTPAAFSADINNLPATDSWGNSLTSTWVGGTATGFPATVVTSGSSWYTLQNLENAGINVLDNAAQAARVGMAASNLPYIVYTVGLGSVNDPLLLRIANAKASPVFQTTYTEGKYYNAPTTAQLYTAFADIASDILRLAR